MTAKTSQTYSPANSHLLGLSLAAPEVALLEVVMSGHTTALQVDHDDVPQEGHHVPLLALRVEVEAEPGEAGDDGVQLGLDDGQQDEESQLATPQQNQWTQILNRMIIIISIIVCSS